MRPFLVYLLRCADGSYYCGHTDDLVARLLQHTNTESGYTASRKPVQLVWQGEFESREQALKFELQVKGWSRAKKEALVNGDWERIRGLSRSRQQSFDSAQDRLRQAQPEWEEAQPECAVRAARLSTTVRPEPVEGPITEAFDEALRMRLLRGERRALAKAITLLESTRPDHRVRGDALLNALLPHTGQAMRLGISGVPGVGKSTFIEVLGLHLIAQGHRVAVLTIDPSSTVSGGSILGDKTRMERLSVNDAAYIRPSPSSGTLGGVAEKTREAMLVCEAAGYDVVIVETVGVGQSETAVAGMTDMFVLLQLPNAGDDLQAIKKGVMELADLVVINKADLDPDAATRAQAQITSSLRVFSFHGNPAHGADRWQPQVLQMSALKAAGLDEFWSAVQRFHRLRHASHEFEQRRTQQALAWMWDIVHARLRSDFDHHPAVRGALPAMLADVRAARLAPSAAARALLNLFEKPTP